MDGKRILEAAEFCTKHIYCVGCVYHTKKESNFNIECDLQINDAAEKILAVRDHILREIGELVEKTIDDINEFSEHECGFRRMGELMLSKLYDMKGDAR